jgi:hypothetical protein
MKDVVERQGKYVYDPRSFAAADQEIDDSNPFQSRKLDASTPFQSRKKNPFQGRKDDADGFIDMLRNLASDDEDESEDVQSETSSRAEKKRYYCTLKEIRRESERGELPKLFWCRSKIVETFPEDRAHIKLLRRCGSCHYIGRMRRTCDICNSHELQVYATLQVKLEWRGTTLDAILGGTELGDCSLQLCHSVYDASKLDKTAQFLIAAYAPEGKVDGSSSITYRIIDFEEDHDETK